MRSRVFVLVCVIVLTVNLGMLAGCSLADKNTEVQSVNTDLDALEQLIAEQRALGATVSEDVTSGYYEWNVDEELVAIDWKDCSLSGSISFSNFSKLMILDCSENNLESLDISNNTALTELRCSENNLESLDISNNTALAELRCSKNNLKSLDVSNNAALALLYCSNNKLTSLDVSNNKTLTWLDCSNNKLSSLDISDIYISLDDLTCDDNVAIKNTSTYSDTSLSDVDLDCKEIENIVLEFASAYFNDDSNAIGKFLASTYNGKISTYQGKGKIGDLKVKGLSYSKKKQQIISLEFRDSEYEDTLRYLTFTFVKQEDNWKIQFYGLEG